MEKSFGIVVQWEWSFCEGRWGMDVRDIRCGQRVFIIAVYVVYHPLPCKRTRPKNTARNHCMLTLHTQPHTPQEDESGKHFRAFYVLRLTADTLPTRNLHYMRCPDADSDTSSSAVLPRVESLTVTTIHPRPRQHIVYYIKKFQDGTVT